MTHEPTPEHRSLANRPAPSPSEGGDITGPHGETRPRQEGKPVPRLPHERDESASSQTGPDHEVIRQAARDLEAGLVDTDKGPPLRETHDRLFGTKASG